MGARPPLARWRKPRLPRVDWESPLLEAWEHDVLLSIMQVFPEQNRALLTGNVHH